MASFEIRETSPGRYRLEGDLTFATVRAALQATLPLFRKGENLRFDLGGIDRADSAAAALLVEWMRRAEPAGRIRYAHLPESLWAIVRVSGVDELLPLEPDPAGPKTPSRTQARDD